jgi:hypothetical protein
MNRRDFLHAAAGLTGGCLLSPHLTAGEPKRRRVAAVNSIYYKLSHSYHIVGRFVYGYTVAGKHHQPAFDVVRMFNHQYHADGRMQDLARPLAKKKGIELVDTVADALGGKGSLDVDAVLMIVEHGDYPRNDRGQILYPRAEFFEQIVEVFKSSKRTAPVFCDKHLSYDHAKARKMYDTAREMGFGLMAGSSLPVTWRRPEWEPEFGAKVEEAVVCYYADPDIYGIHALETLQCLLERRRGGETGVKSVTALTGDAVWKAWDRGAWSNELAEAALRRSSTRDYGTPRDLVESPRAALVEYLDGTRAALLHLPGYVADITAAVKLAGDPKPHATWFVLPAPPGARFFDPLTFHIEKFFAAGKPPWPVERTLLTTTVHDFAMRSAAEGGMPMSDTALKVAYTPPNESFFFKGPYSDE